MLPIHAELTAFAKEAHALALEKGFHKDAERSRDKWRELVSLIQGEFHEALADLRKRRPVGAITNVSGVPLDLATYDPVRDGKPVGVLVELADVVIRALDAIVWSGAPSLPSPERLTPADAAHYRERTAKDFCEVMSLSLKESTRPRDLLNTAYACLEWAHFNDYDLWRVVLMKHEFNRTREPMHGRAF